MRQVGLLLVAGFVAAACGGGVVSESTTTVPVTSTMSTTTTMAPATTTTMWDSEAWLTEDGPAALAVLDQYYAALNRGDADTANTLVAPAVMPDLTIAHEGVGARFEYECHLDQSQPRVVCSERLHDNLYSPAGVAWAQGVAFQVEDGTIVREWMGCLAPPEGFRAYYLLDLYDWMVNAHPDMGLAWTGNLSAGELGIPCTPYPFRSVEDAQQVVALVPEFLDQSASWPSE